MVRHLKNKSGFTLVELLVAVAIVGVLATAGIPQYRRMVQKSKKSEAKIFLGDIANAEAAFFSEFGAYGSNLSAMGVEMDSGPQRIYMAGFTSGACGAGFAVLPTAASSWGGLVNAQNPAYYTAFVANTSMRFGRMTRTAGCADTSAAAEVVGGNTFSPLADGSSVFKAAASGVIGTGNLDTSVTTDQWMINESRTLVNNVDGTN